MGEARIDFGGSDRVSELIEKINKQLLKQEDKLKEIGRASTESERKAIALWKNSQTPLEKYNQKLADAKPLLKDLEHGQERYNAVVRKARDELDRATGAQSVLGKLSTTSLASMASGWLSVGTVIAGATSALREFHDERQRGADMAAGSAFDRGALGQMGGGAEGAIRGLLQSGAFDDPGAAARLVAAAKGAGFEADLPLLGRLRGSLLVQDPQQLASSANRLRESMGAQQTGPLRQIIAKSLVAGDIADAQIDALLSQAAIAGTPAQQVGLGDEGVLAAIGVLSRVGNIEATGTGFASLLAELNAKGIRSGDGSLASLIRSVPQGMELGQLATRTLGALRTTPIPISQFERDIGAAGDERIESAIQSNLREFGPEIEDLQTRGEEAAGLLGRSPEALRNRARLRRLQNIQFGEGPPGRRFDAWFVRKFFEWTTWAGGSLPDNIGFGEADNGATLKAIERHAAATAAGVRAKQVPVPAIER